MLFPYDQVTWSSVDGVMFAGWGTALPGLTTLIGAALCLMALIVVHISEAHRSARFSRK